MSLEGVQFLVASRGLVDPNFARSVVLVIRHSDEGATGLVINRPTKTTVAEAWRQVSERAFVRRTPISFTSGVLAAVRSWRIVHADAALGEIELAVAETYFCAADPEKHRTADFARRGADTVFHWVCRLGSGPTGSRNA